jgi:hypothetical protein
VDVELAAGQLDTDEQMLGTSDLGNREDQPGGRVIDGGAGDAQQVDRCSTVERGEGNGVPDMSTPLHPPGTSVKGVEAIALGSHKDALPDDEGFGIDGPIQVRGPGMHQACGVGRVGQVAGAGIVVVIGRPVAALLAALHSRKR